MISKARKYLNKSVLLALYYTLVYPYLLYCVIIWGNSPKSYLWPIFKLQKYAIRLISNLKKYSRSTPEFKKMKIIKVPDLYPFAVSIFMFKHQHGLLPPIFNSYYNNNLERESMTTRQVSLLSIPMYKTTLGSKNIKKVGVKIWNEIIANPCIDHQGKIGAFKKAIIKSITDTYLIAQ